MDFEERLHRYSLLYGAVIELETWIRELDFYYDQTQNEEMEKFLDEVVAQSEKRIRKFRREMKSLNISEEDYETYG